MFFLFLIDKYAISNSTHHHFKFKAKGVTKKIIQLHSWFYLLNNLITQYSSSVNFVANSKTVWKVIQHFLVRSTPSYSRDYSTTLRRKQTRLLHVSFCCCWSPNCVCWLITLQYTFHVWVYPRATLRASNGRPLTRKTKNSKMFLKEMLGG